jgi:hypothetical protein
MYCLCVNVYCHRVRTQLQLINISYYNKLFNKLFVTDNSNAKDTPISAVHYYMAGVFVSLLGAY